MSDKVKRPDWKEDKYGKIGPVDHDDSGAERYHADMEVYADAEHAARVEAEQARDAIRIGWDAEHKAACAAADKARQIIAKAERERDDLRKRVATVLRDLLKAHRQLMPGVAHIPVQDYRIINEAPLAADELLKEIDL